MAEPGFASVDDYIGSFPPEVQAALRAVRRAIHEAVPEAEESISYQMPAYRLGGRPVLYFAAYKGHYSLFGTTEGVGKAFRKELSRYEGTGRGTLRFPLDEPVPVDLIHAIAAHRAKEALEEGATGARKR